MGALLQVEVKRAGLGVVVGLGLNRLADHFRLGKDHKPEDAIQMLLEMTLPHYLT